MGTGIDYYHANIFENLFLFWRLIYYFQMIVDSLSYFEIRAVIHFKLRMECILLDVTGDKRPN